MNIEIYILEKIENFLVRERFSCYYILEVWELGDILRWTIVKLYHQKVAGSIPVWGSEIVFLGIELDDRSSIISTWTLFFILSYQSRNSSLFDKCYT